MALDLSMNPFPMRLPSMDVRSWMPKSNEIDHPEQKWQGDFIFIQGADTQFGMIQHYLLQQDDPNWDREMKLTKMLISTINTMNPKPKFFVVCGDMLDSFPYKGLSREVRSRQYDSFVNIFRELHPSIRLVCVCGNHDVGDDPTVETLQIYREQFGPDVFSFWVGGVKFVVLNSQWFQVPDALPEETERQIKLLENEAKDDKAKHIVAFQHIPFFIKSPDEPKEYFNIDESLRTVLLEKLYDVGIRNVFCGHYHRNGGGFYKDMELVITSAVGCPLGDDMPGYRIVEVTQDKISHKYVNIVDSVDAIKNL